MAVAVAGVALAHGAVLRHRQREHRPAGHPGRVWAGWLRGEHEAGPRSSPDSAAGPGELGKDLDRARCRAAALAAMGSRLAPEPARVDGRLAAPPRPKHHDTQTPLTSPTAEPTQQTKRGLQGQTSTAHHLVLLPTLDLLSQAVRERRLAGHSGPAVAVCSLGTTRFCGAWTCARRHQRVTS